MRDEITEADNMVPSDGSGDEALSNQSSDHQDEDSESDNTSEDTHSDHSSNQQDEDSDNTGSSDDSGDDACSSQSDSSITSNSSNLDCSCSDYEDPITGVIFEQFEPGVRVYPYREEILPVPNVPPIILPVSSGKVIFNPSCVRNTLKVSPDCTSLIALPASKDGEKAVIL